MKSSGPCLRILAAKSINHGALSIWDDINLGVNDGRVKLFFSVRTKLQVLSLIDTAVSASVDMQSDFDAFDFFNRTGRVGMEVRGGGGERVKIRYRFPLRRGFIT